MKRVVNFLGILGLALTLSGCGRKQRNIFSFKKKEICKVNALDFPSMHGVCVLSTNYGNKIAWHPVNQLDLQDEQFVGYNVYRLTNHGFIQKKPLNSFPLKNNVFMDNQQEHKVRSAYLVHAVFRVHNQCIQGPASQIVWSR